MEDDIPPTVTTNTNDDSSENLKPDSNEPWESNPDETTDKPVISATLPEDATITEVELKEPENVEYYIVTVTDSDGNTKTVIFILFHGTVFEYIMCYSDT